MPRRGQYGPVPEPAEPPAAPLARIGVREAVSKAGGTTRAVRIEIDPGRFQCTVLAGELADDWVRWAMLRRPGPVALQDMRQAVESFAAFADAAALEPAVLSLASAAPEAARLLREWRRTLSAGYGRGSVRPWKIDNMLTQLIRFRMQRGDATTGPEIRQLVSGYSSVRLGRSRELDEFTRQEKAALVRAAWSAVVEAEHRLERGRMLLKQARGHPAEHGWQDPANLLWLLADGGDPRQIAENLPSPKDWPDSLIEIAGLSGRSVYRRIDLVRALVWLLYPRIGDLMAFRILLAAATGLVDEISALTEDGVEFTESAVVLTLPKRRAHAVRHRRFADHGPLSPVEVLRRLMVLTEDARLRSATRPARLLTAGRVSDRYQLSFSVFETNTSDGTLSLWTRARGLELSEPVDIRRMRKSVKVEKIIAHRGRIAAVADDHTEATFLGHYAGGTTVRVIAGQIVAQTQQEWLERAMAAPRILDQATVELLDDPQVRTGLGISRENVDRLREGALNMGVSDCSDPFNPPHSRPGELCAVAPLHCLECGNALILPSNLPQLLLMHDFIEQMRLRLAPPLFHAQWAQRRANLAAALGARTPAEIEQARDQIAGLGLRLQLPLSSHTEFDL
jgi:hypothetical protein